jgi:4-hydroxy-3-methylbut-2-enyl diphosphate reductase
MRVILAKPRSFCAGVERALRCVDRALELYAHPIYVLRDIVHNTSVIREFNERGIVFVRDLEDVPRGALVLFSAHGVGPESWAAARARALQVVDATCPLVEKVHREARSFAQAGYSIILIGEKTHDEVMGTQAWASACTQVVFSESEVESLSVPDSSKVAYLTQTTLSVDDCEMLVAALRRRFPAIQGPSSNDVCYATRNRQRAVNELVAEADIVLIIGDASSANSKRLAAICLRKVERTHLVASAAEIQDDWFKGVETVLISSGASVPEHLVNGVVERLRRIVPCEVEEREVARENLHFRLPAALEERL